MKTHKEKELEDTKKEVGCLVIILVIVSIALCIIGMIDYILSFIKN